MIATAHSGIGAVLAGALLAVALPNPVQGSSAAPVPMQPSSLAVASPVAIGAAVARVPVRAPAAVAARGRLAVGDSLMVSVTPRMKRKGFRVQAKVGRQFSTAPGIVGSYGARLPRNVVIELGTNGTIRPSDCRSVVRRAGKTRRVFLVTPRVPRSWQKANLRTLRACDKRYKASRVRIVDWYGYSAGHRSWLAPDGVHLSAAGQRKFARLIDRAVDRHGLR